MVGLDYKAQSPWEAKAEFPKLFAAVAQEYQSIEIIANSIGAFFAMNVLVDERIEKAYFISPVVNMQKLILNMMAWAGVTERELRNKKEIQTNFGKSFPGNISAMQGKIRLSGLYLRIFCTVKMII